MPRKKKLYTGESGEHRHFFQPVDGKDELKCIGLVGPEGDGVECGVVALTGAEYFKRAGAWETYYKAVVANTEAYSLCHIMRAAFKKNDKKMMQETRLRLREMSVEGRNELPKPPFKDCVYELHTGKLIIQREESEMNQDGRVTD